MISQPTDESQRVHKNWSVGSVRSYTSRKACFAKSYRRFLKPNPRVPSSPYFPGNRTHVRNSHFRGKSPNPFRCQLCVHLRHHDRFSSAFFESTSQSRTRVARVSPHTCALARCDWFLFRDNANVSPCAPFIPRELSWCAAMAACNFLSAASFSSLFQEKPTEAEISI